MACHIAILQQPYLGWILEGKKTIESRFTKVCCAPFGEVMPGDRIYLKQSGGPFVGSAVASRVYFEDQLSPNRVEQIRKQFDDQICGEPAFWEQKASASKYCTLIWLRDLRKGDEAPSFTKQHMRAWYVLADDVDPLVGQARSKPLDAAEMTQNQDFRTQPKAIELVLTAGAIRQGYLRLGQYMNYFPKSTYGGLKKEKMGKPIKLKLLDGPEIETDIVEARQMFRARGFKGWYASQGLSENDVVIIQQIENGLYRVGFKRGSKRIP